ncbi:MAG: PQQ-binding-like beta-propeller repeat protein [Bacteroidales bacterium]|nr:PQQ-binding-like beta-propeller repeat protein [Bacteroidales bacterium]
MKLKSILVAIAIICAAHTAWAQRFAVLSDVHVTPGNACDKYLREAVAEINAGDFDLVVVNGDLTNEGSDAELANVKSILDGIRHRLVVLPGNHELNWSQSATKTFFDLWGNDRFVTEVDSLIVVGISCGPYMKMGDGHIKQEDLHWLRATLDERVVPGKRVLSFNHYPLQADLDNWQEYVNTLSAYPVIGHINGHYHTWKHYMAGDIPAVMTRALDMRNGTYGYAIVEVGPEWVHVYNKNIGDDRAVPMLAFAVPDVTDMALVSYPDNEWSQPEGFEIKKVWTDSASVFTRLAFDDRNVYFGNSLGQVKAVDKTTGRQMWSVPTGASVFSRPVVLDKGRIAFPAATGIKLVSADGRKVSELPSREGPYVADGLMTPRGWVQGAYKRIEMRDPRTARLLWTYDSLFNYCQAAPAVDGDDLIFGAWDTNLRCLDLKTGRLKWVWNNGKPANMLGPGNVVPAITAERVYIVAPDRYMTAIDRTTGKTLWRDNSHRYRESMGISADGTRIYAKTMDGDLVAVDATVPVFKELWTVDMGLGYEHAPCIVLEHDGVVYAGSRRGIVTAVDPYNRTVLWSLPLGVSEINGIDLDAATGDIWVSLIEGTVFRIKKL